MSRVKKYPFYSEEELNTALNILKEYNEKFYILADITSRTAAELADILQITNRQMFAGSLFMVDLNNHKTVSLSLYREYLNFPGGMEKKKSFLDAPFFQKDGIPYKDSNIRAFFSRISSTSGVDLSLIRFQKTFYLDYLIRVKDRQKLKVVQTRGQVNSFCNEEWLKNYLGLSKAAYDAILKGSKKYSPILTEASVKKEEDSEVQLDALCDQLIGYLKDVKKEQASMTQAERLWAYRRLFEMEKILSENNKKKKS